MRIRCGEFRGAVRLDRTTFERLIAPHVGRTVDALRRTVASAGVAPKELTALLLVGGSARIPLVARTVTEQLGCGPRCAATTTWSRAEPSSRFPPRPPAADVVAPTTSGAAAIPSRGAAAEADAPDSAEEPSADDAEAPTVVLAVPAVAGAPTTPLLLSATVEIGRPGTWGPADTSPPGEPRANRLPSWMPAAAAPHGAAWLRTLVGVGAVIVAALVLVALFRARRSSRSAARSRGRERCTQLIAPAEVATAPTAGVPALGPCRRPRRSRRRCGAHGSSCGGRHPPVGDHHTARPPEPVGRSGRHRIPHRQHPGRARRSTARARALP